MSDHPVDIQFALVSHTNNGKTTLARTLVGVDVGEVRDAAHVTVTSEAHLLQTSAAGDRLLLWDTPGFGDSVRLLKRLAMAGNPIGWFLREVFDRYRDRPFWLSQQALKAAKEAADVVLYLVNSSEDPRDAGYLAAEMRILEWLNKPVVVLLNQLGPPRPDNLEQGEQARWKQHLSQYGIVRDVLALDAFARCWVHEDVFYDRVGKLVEPSKQAGYARLLAGWQAENLRRFDAALALSAQLLAAAARDEQDVADDDGKGKLLRSALKMIKLGKGEQQRQDTAMAGLVERLERRIGDTTVGLLRLYRLDPGQAGRINARVREHFAVRAPVDKAQAGLLGAVVSGAATGLSADLMAGGLTLGGGALIGAIVGGLTAAGAAWGFNTSTERAHPSVQFADPFLRTLLVGSVLRYLAVAHFGRGRGNFVEAEAPPFWQAEVEAALGRREAALAGLWQTARAAPDAAAAAGPLQALLGQVTVETLERLYPDAAARALARARL
ncbi:GTPase domain-containing protein [Massilia forsythiae]|uniref:GTPase domain-containing protein n=1 Tax=Massilia forsythiae TaxID=2728020 RepID=A0A7Z2VVT5_9BURK|nr:GTPase domain-containing protein [Massilia forsythiae]QJE00141.1 GTPase domain-containing protein [Massilia forsythiae]